MPVATGKVSDKGKARQALATIASTGCSLTHEDALADSFVVGAGRSPNRVLLRVEAPESIPGHPAQQPVPARCTCRAAADHGARGASLSAGQAHGYFNCRRAR